MRRGCLLPVLAGLSLPVAAGGQPARPAFRPRVAVRRGLEFLLEHQNPDGSWGGPGGAVYTFSGAVWPNPETHRSWRVATTGLACLALLELGHSERQLAAADRAVAYLRAKAGVKRPCEWDTMNNWAYIYGLQALAAACGQRRYAAGDRRGPIRRAAQQLIRKLAYHQSLNGGWGYLEFDPPRTARPQWATSFMTAAAVIALVEARQQGLEVDAGMLRRAVKAIRRCRLPSGAYTYSVPAIADPRGAEWIDRVKGSLGRIQVCNLALRLAGDELPAERLRRGLQAFFGAHRFLDIARQRPIPHEAYYYNSGYFYLFGHYYAARVIALLPPAARQKYWPLLQYQVIKTQQRDRSMWDYDLHAYHKPYGTAFGLLALAPSLEPAAAAAP